MSEGVPAPAAAPAAASFEPEVFGRYYLVDRIAVGGMAEIFRAKTFGAGGFENTLVIKRILAHLSENEQFVRMFMDEAKVSALLHQSNIVRIYDFGKLQNNFFIAMEQVEGKDVKMVLRKLSERRKVLPQPFAVYIAMESAKGLDYAHKRTTLQGQPLNIVHRDVSPSNLLVSYNGEVKVADFGIVKAANCAETTGAGTLKGKFEYMSPEQASGKELDRRSDIFSLGIILHEMLTGRRLFKTDNEIKTLERIKSGDVPLPSTINPEVPARLDEIVMRALALDPETRYQDARQLHADLLEFLYPASPDTTQQMFSHFMRELFEEEIALEQKSMEEGTRRALTLHESGASVDLDPEWEEDAGSGSHSGRTLAQPPPRGLRPSVIVAMVVGGFALLMAGFGITWLLRDLWTTPSVQVVEVPAPVDPTSSTGSVDVKGAPENAVITLDGKQVGTGAAVVVSDLAPDVPHTLVVTAEGFEPYQETVQVAAGERLRLPITLQPVAPVKPTPSTPPKNPTTNPTPPPTPKVDTAEKVVLSLSSTPPGADIWIEGKKVGQTPMDYGATSGTRYGIEYRLDGYETVRFSATPEPGSKAVYARTLKQENTGSGKVSVNVKGGWGDVYIDGKKVGTTPLQTVVTAGSHQVRVVNKEAGLDRTETIEVKAGEVRPVSFAGN